MRHLESQRFFYRKNSAEKENNLTQQQSIYKNTPKFFFCIISLIYCFKLFFTLLFSFTLFSMNPLKASSFSEATEEKIHRHLYPKSSLETQKMASLAS